MFVDRTMYGFNSERVNAFIVTELSVYATPTPTRDKCSKVYHVITYTLPRSLLFFNDTEEA